MFNHIKNSEGLPDGAASVVKDVADSMAQMAQELGNNSVSMLQTSVGTIVTSAGIVTAKVKQILNASLDLFINKMFEVAADLPPHVFAKTFMSRALYGDKDFWSGIFYEGVEEAKAKLTENPTEGCLIDLLIRLQSLIGTHGITLEDYEQALNELKEFVATLPNAMSLQALITINLYLFRSELFANPAFVKTQMLHDIAQMLPKIPKKIALEEFLARIEYYRVFVGIEYYNQMLRSIVILLDTKLAEKKEAGTETDPRLNELISELKQKFQQQILEITNVTPQDENILLEFSKVEFYPVLQALEAKLQNLHEESLQPEPKTPDVTYDVALQEMLDLYGLAVANLLEPHRKELLKSASTPRTEEKSAAETSVKEIAPQDLKAPKLEPGLSPIQSSGIKPILKSKTWLENAAHNTVKALDWMAQNSGKTLTLGLAFQAVAAAALDPTGKKDEETEIGVANQHCRNLLEDTFAKLNTEQVSGMVCEAITRGNDPSCINEIVTQLEEVRKTAETSEATASPTTKAVFASQPKSEITRVKRTVAAISGVAMPTEYQVNSESDYDQRNPTAAVFNGMVLHAYESQDFQNYFTRAPMVELSSYDGQTIVRGLTPSDSIPLNRFRPIPLSFESIWKFGILYNAQNQTTQFWDILYRPYQFDNTTRVATPLPIWRINSNSDRDYRVPSGTVLSNNRAAVGFTSLQSGLWRASYKVVTADGAPICETFVGVPSGTAHQHNPFVASSSRSNPEAIICWENVFPGVTRNSIDDYCQKFDGNCNSLINYRLMNLHDDNNQYRIPQVGIFSNGLGVTTSMLNFNQVVNQLFNASNLNLIGTRYDVTRGVNSSIGIVNPTIAVSKTGSTFLQTWEAKLENPYFYDTEAQLYNVASGSIQPIGSFYPLPLLSRDDDQQLFTPVEIDFAIQDGPGPTCVATGANDYVATFSSRRPAANAPGGAQSDYNGFGIGARRLTAQYEVAFPNKVLSFTQGNSIPVIVNIPTSAYNPVSQVELTIPSYAGVFEVTDSTGATSVLGTDTSRLTLMGPSYGLNAGILNSIRIRSNPSNRQPFQVTVNATDTTNFSTAASDSFTLTPQPVYQLPSFSQFAPIDAPLGTLFSYQIPATAITTDRDLNLSSITSGSCGTFPQQPWLLFNSNTRSFYSPYEVPRAAKDVTNCFRLTALDTNGGNAQTDLFITGRASLTVTNTQQRLRGFENRPLPLSGLMPRVTTGARTFIATMELVNPADGVFSTNRSGTAASSFFSGRWTAAGDLAADVDDLVDETTFTPSPYRRGNFSMIYSADDGFNDPFSTLRVLEIAEVPYAPVVVNPISNQTMRVGESREISAVGVFEELNGYPLTLSAAECESTSLSAGAQFSNSSLTVRPTNPGTTCYSIFARNPQGLTTVSNFSVTAENNSNNDLSNILIIGLSTGIPLFFLIAAIIVILVIVFRKVHQSKVDARSREGDDLETQLARALRDYLHLTDVDNFTRANSPGSEYCTQISTIVSNLKDTEKARTRGVNFSGFSENAPDFEVYNLAVALGDALQARGLVRRSGCGVFTKISLSSNMLRGHDVIDAVCDATAANYSGASGAQKKSLLMQPMQ